MSGNMNSARGIFKECGDFRYGACPQQVEGIDKAGRPFYFRERHQHWTLHVGPVGVEPDYLVWSDSQELIAEGVGQPEPDGIDAIITKELGAGWVSR
ncbi:MAG: hypothetical protein E6Q97_02575 [Desulfurellales bacterium]|nr:MAG: hypothetical protein E6Q97_02575 [Desulfurellales bacterium]